MFGLDCIFLNWDDSKAENIAAEAGGEAMNRGTFGTKGNVITGESARPSSPDKVIEFYEHTVTILKKL